MVPMAYQCRLKFCHWQSFVTISTNGMPMVTSGCHLVSPLVANLADNLEGRQNYQRAKLTSFFKSSTYENSVITVQFNAFPS